MTDPIADAEKRKAERAERHARETEQRRVEEEKAKAISGHEDAPAVVQPSVVETKEPAKTDNKRQETKIPSMHSTKVKTVNGRDILTNKD